MKINQLKLGVILSYLQMFLSSAISIIYTPFMLRTLGQSEYGLYNLASSVIAYLALLSFGFGSSYIRFYSQYKNNNERQNIARLNSLFLITFIGFGILALFSGIILADNVALVFDDGLTPAELVRIKNLMLILTVNISISFPMSVFVTYITSQEKFVFLKMLGMIKTVVSPLTMIPVLLMEYKSIGMVTVTLCISFFSDVINMFYCLKHLKMEFSFKKLNFRVLYEVAGFSIFIALNSVIDQVNWNIDKLLLGRYRGTIGVAIYGIASQLNMMYLNFSSSIASVFTPRIHKIISEKQPSEIITELFTRVGRIQFIILGLLSSGLILFGKPFIKLWAGANYEDSYYIALLLILPVTIPLIQNLGIEIQRAYNKHRFRSLLCGLMAVINLLISIPLCKYFGGVGNAFGTAVSLILVNGIAMNIYYSKIININIKFFWLQIIKFSFSIAVSFLSGLLMCRFVDCERLLNLVICIAIYTIVYVISVWFLGMNEYEKGLIRKPFNKLKMLTKGNRL